MSTGRVCEKHDEWCPDGECPWCEPVAERQAPPEPVRFDDWTPGEPVTLDGVPVQWPSREWKQRASVVLIPQAALDAVGRMTLDQLLLRVNADEAKALRAFKLRLAEALYAEDPLPPLTTQEVLTAPIVHATAPFEVVKSLLNPSPDPSGVYIAEWRMDEATARSMAMLAALLFPA